MTAAGWCLVLFAAGALLAAITGSALWFAPCLMLTAGRLMWIMDREW